MKGENADIGADDGFEQINGNFKPPGFPAEPVVG
jgi:hypothetical protein